MVQGKWLLFSQKTKKAVLLPLFLLPFAQNVIFA